MFKGTATLDAYISECKKLHFASAAEKNQVISRFQDVRTMLALDFELRNLERYDREISEKTKVLNSLKSLTSSEFLSDAQKKKLNEMIGDHENKLTKSSEGNK
jgi:hypothetical protein